MPDKIKEANKIISKKGYGLFVFPTFSDFYALFIDKLEKREKLLQTEFVIDERIPPHENFIQLYEYEKTNASDSDDQPSLKDVSPRKKSAKKKKNNSGLDEKQFEKVLKKFRKEWTYDEEDMKEEEADYQEVHDKITKIVEEKNVNRDHVLLIDIGSLYSYYRTKWKQDVLVNGESNLEALKQLQIMTFYKCMHRIFIKHVILIC